MTTTKDALTKDQRFGLQHIASSCRYMLKSLESGVVVGTAILGFDAAAKEIRNNIAHFEKLPWPEQPFDFDDEVDFHGQAYSRIRNGVVEYGDIFMDAGGELIPCAGYIGEDVCDESSTYGARFYRLHTIAEQQVQDDS